MIYLVSNVHIFDRHFSERLKCIWKPVDPKHVHQIVGSENLGLICKKGNLSECLHTSAKSFCRCSCSVQNCHVQANCAHRQRLPCWLTRYIRRQQSMMRMQRFSQRDILGYHASSLRDGRCILLLNFRNIPDFPLTFLKAIIKKKEVSRKRVDRRGDGVIHVSQGHEARKRRRSSEAELMTKLREAYVPLEDDHQRSVDKRMNWEQTSKTCWKRKCDLKYVILG